MKTTWIIPAVVIASVGYVIWRKRALAASALAPTVIPTPSIGAGAKPINTTLTPIAPVPLTPIATPQASNPFTSANPFLNF